MKRIGKSVFMLLLCLVIAAAVLPVRANAADVAINATNFPDEIFRSYVSTNFDTDGNGFLNQSELESVTSIDCANKGITTLKGVEHFGYLMSLSCDDNNLKSLNLSNNTNLTNIRCSGNALTSLILPNYKENDDPGVTIDCERNYLTSLDLSKCTGWTSLNCSDNYMKSLDLSKSTSVGTLYCINNKLTSLKVPKRCSLIYCGDNPLTQLDLSQSSLNELYCEDCQLTALNVSGCTFLKILSCGGNPMTTLNASGCTALTMMACDYGGNLKSLNVSGCTAMTRLDCKYNNLISLDVTGCTALTQLDCSTNSLKTLDLTGCTALRLLYCSSNNLTQLDLSMCPSLETLNCWNNSLTELNVSMCPSLETLSCSNNNLAILDITDNPGLTRLSCSGNPIGILDLRWNITLKNLVMAGEKTYAYTAYGIQFVTYGNLTAPPTTRLKTNIYCEPPVISVQPETAFTSEGETVTFSFTAATPRDTALQYQWYCDNEAIQGETGPTLEVTAEAGMSGSKYFCEVRNQGGVVCTKTVSFRYVTTPKITTQPKAASVKAGKKVTFKVKASGEDLHYQWYYQKPKTSKWVKISGKTKATYSFTAKKSQNGYKYRCIVTNAAGKATSKAVKLTVK